MSRAVRHVTYVFYELDSGVGLRVEGGGRLVLVKTWTQMREREGGEDVEMCEFRGGVVRKKKRRRRRLVVGGRRF